MRNQITSKHRIWALALGTILLCSVPPVLAQSTETAAGAESRPDVAKYGKVYKGSEGEIVELVRFGPAEAGEFLALVSRVDHEVDGKVLKLKAINAGSGFDYGYEAEDGRHNLIVERISGADKSYQLYLGNSKPINLKFDKKLSEEMKPQHLLTEYLEQERQAKRRAARLNQ